MYYRNKFSKYTMHANDGGDGGEGGGGDNGGGEGGDSAAQLADMQTQLTALKAKNEQLLTETKTAKTERRNAEEAAQTASQDALKKAGDFESLYNSSQAELEKSNERYSGLQKTVSTEKRNNAAMKMAGELAEGSNAELLSEFIQRRLQHTDEGLKVTDANGNLTVSSMDDLKREFSNDPRYSALLKGNQSSGGGANGGANGGGAAKQLGRAEFDALNPAKRMEFIKSGGTITD